MAAGSSLVMSLWLRKDEREHVLSPCTKEEIESGLGMSNGPDELSPDKKDHAFLGGLWEPKRGDVFSCIPSLAGSGHWMHCSGFGQTCSSNKPVGTAGIGGMVSAVFSIRRLGRNK